MLVKHVHYNIGCWMSRLHAFCVPFRIPHAPVIIYTCFQCTAGNANQLTLQGHAWGILGTQGHAWGILRRSGYRCTSVLFAQSNRGLWGIQGITYNSTVTFDHLMANDPDITFFIGDLTYADNWMTNGGSCSKCKLPSLRSLPVAFHTDASHDLVG